MISLTDNAIVLSRRAHGVGAAIVQLHTAAHGKVAVYVHGARAAETRAIWTTGNVLEIDFTAAAAGALGRAQGTLEASPAADLAGLIGQTAALASSCALVAETTNEWEPNPHVHAALADLLLKGLFADDWATLYAQWELQLASQLGYGRLPALLSYPSNQPSQATLQKILARSGRLLAYHCRPGAGGLPACRQALATLINPPAGERAA